MFGRVTITLGIGPHSSCFIFLFRFFSLSVMLLVMANNGFRSRNADLRCSGRHEDSEAGKMITVTDGVSQVAGHR